MLFFVARATRAAICFRTMTARAIASSTISFGLVSLPVKLYSTAESSRRISFNMIWKERGVRVRQQYIDPADGAVVPKDEIVKGYEFAKDQYVLFSDGGARGRRGAQVGRDRDRPASCRRARSGGSTSTRRTTSAPTRAAPEPTACSPRRWRDRSRRARQARDAGQAVHRRDPSARGGAAPGAALLRRRDPSPSPRFPSRTARSTKPSSKLATKLIEQAAADDFEPMQFQDEVRERTLELIEQEGRRPGDHRGAGQESKTKIIDLMAALKASIKEVRRREEARHPSREEGRSGSRQRQEEDDEAQEGFVGLTSRPRPSRP
jgi:DNA end-binding protein Ku